MVQAEARVLPERMPVISYEDHPLYASASGGGNRSSDRLRALARVLQMIGYVTWVRAGQLMQRVGWHSKGDGPGLRQLEQDGVFIYRLHAAAKRAVEAAAQPLFDHLEASRSAIGDGERGYCDNQLDTTRKQAPELYNTVEHLLSETGILNSVRDYLGCRAVPRKITLQINDDRDRFWREHFAKRGLPIPAAAFFHVDNTFGVVKVMFYMSEVFEENGPFSYVPGSHRIKVGRLESVVLRATDIWLDCYPEERHLFPALPKCLQRKAKFGDDLRSGDKWGKWLVNHERVITSDVGDLIVFDVNGVHRGGMVECGERRVIQVMIS